MIVLFQPQNPGKNTVIVDRLEYGHKLAAFAALCLFADKLKHVFRNAPVQRVFDVGNRKSALIVGGESLQDFTRLQTKNIYAEPLTNLKSALNQTKRKFPLIDVGDYSPEFEELESFSALTTAEVDDLIDKREVIASKLETAKHNLSVTEHFSGLETAISKAEKTKFVNARFGRLPKDNMQKLEAYSDDKYIEFYVCSEDKTHCWGVYFAPIDKTEEIDKVFEGLFFEPTELISADDSPAQKAEEIKSQIKKLEAEFAQAQKNLDKYLDENKEQITRCLSKLEELYLYAGIRNKALQHNKSFIIVGWIPSSSKKQLRDRLKSITSVELDFSDAKDELDKSPPVKLKNCFLARPFAYYTESHALCRNHIYNNLRHNVCRSGTGRHSRHHRNPDVEAKENAHRKNTVPVRTFRNAFRNAVRQRFRL